MVGRNLSQSAQPLLPTDKGYTFVGCVVLLIPALITAGAAFAPTARGPWIAAAFLLPPLVFAVVRGTQWRGTGYRIATALSVLPIAGLLGIAAAFLLPYAFLDIDNPYLWLLWGSLACAGIAGFLLGLARHDPEKQRRSIARRYVPSEGRLVIDPSKSQSSGMRDSTGSPALDILVKIVWYFFVFLILAGLFLGGGAGYILVDVLEKLWIPPQELDLRIMIVEGVALIAIGPLAMIMPSLWLGWRELDRLEKLI